MQVALNVNFLETFSVLLTRTLFDNAELIALSNCRRTLMASGAVSSCLCMKSSSTSVSVIPKTLLLYNS